MSAEKRGKKRKPSMKEMTDVGAMWGDEDEESMAAARQFMSSRIKSKKDSSVVEQPPRKKAKIEPVPRAEASHSVKVAKPLISATPADTNDAIESDAEEDENNVIEEDENKVVQPLSKEELHEVQQRHRRRGIIYFSRIPPFMKPIKLRHLMSEYGNIGRVYLVQEDPTIHARRAKSGGNKKMNYTEGWVEFEDKKVAKRVALLLNNKIVGGKKRSFHHDDIWSMKYLPKFSWDQLTETLVYERAVRKERLRTEIAQQRREDEFYITRVGEKKKFDAIAEKKAKRGESLPTGVASADNMAQLRRQFRQREAVGKGARIAAAAAAAEHSDPAD